MKQQQSTTLSGNPRRSARNASNRRSSNKGGKQTSNLDPLKLVKNGLNATEPGFKASQTFESMDLCPELKRNLSSRGFTKPTEIQDRTYSHLMHGRDLVGIASTGTGKTGSFLIPIIQQLIAGVNSFKTLVVVPTRELAQQVNNEFISLTKGTGLRSVCLIGGTSISKDVSGLNRENQLIVGTPGRLLDMVNRRALNLKDVPVLVIDEFDRMLDMGFVNDIMKMVKLMTTRKQTMLFSATIEPSQKSLIASLLNNPVEVKVSAGVSASEQVDQNIIKVPAGADKFEMLRTLINDKDFSKVLIFTQTKRQVDRLGKKLSKSGVNSVVIHGDKSQNSRSNALRMFQNGSAKVLVATDVASRGIDVTDISHVINYQMPLNYDTYVHRVGRTGRAGKTGKALTFVD